MKSLSFTTAMIATHVAYLLIASAAAMYLRGVRRALERMTADLESRIAAQETTRP